MITTEDFAQIGIFIQAYISLQTLLNGSIIRRHITESPFFSREHEDKLHRYVKHHVREINDPNLDVVTAYQILEEKQHWRCKKCDKEMHLTDYPTIEKCTLYHEFLYFQSKETQFYWCCAGCTAAYKTRFNLDQLVEKYTLEEMEKGDENKNLDIETVEIHIKEM